MTVAEQFTDDRMPMKLRVATRLDEFRHLGRTAEFLSLTQPAVSKTLAEIERMFGLDLFVRSTRGTEPTAYGTTIVRFARSVLADYGRTRDEIAAVASGAAGRTQHRRDGGGHAGARWRRRCRCSKRARHRPPCRSRKAT